MLFCQNTAALRTKVSGEREAWHTAGNCISLFSFKPPKLGILWVQRFFAVAPEPVQTVLAPLSEQGVL